MSYVDLGDEKEEAVHQALGSRMKDYEAKTIEKVPVDQYLVVRADGHGFSKFTAVFEKPVDARIKTAMIDTASDALQHFQALVAYTQSDEITLVFPPCDPEKGQTHPNNGRCQKLASLVASYCTIRFNHHLQKACEQSLKALDDPNVVLSAPRRKQLESVKKRIEDPNGHFDARCIGFPSMIEVLNCLYWRSTYDCVRNSIARLAHHHLGHKGCFKKDGKTMMADLKALGVDWEAQDPYFKWGMFLKKMTVLKDFIDPKTGKEGQTLRSQIVMKAFPLKTTEDYAKMLFSKEPF